MVAVANPNEVQEMAVLDFTSVEAADQAIERLHRAGATDDDIRVHPAPVPTAAVTDREFAGVMKVAVAFGIPGAYLLMVAMALVAGVSTGQAFALAAVPAVFCGMFFAGSVAVVAQLDHAEKRAHAQRRASRNARTLVVTGPHSADAVRVVTALSEGDDRAA